MDIGEFKELSISFDEAATRMQRAGALDPRNAMVFFTLGETLAILRRYDEARASADRAVTLSPDAGSGSEVMYSIQSAIS